ncbi:MAG: dockerin type I domain-containing protein [Saprospiraceae bacterium]
MQFGDLDLSLNYTIKPERTDDPLNGVSTQDIVLIQKHILGKAVIASPYRLIAADVNNSGNITGADIAEIRKLILGIIPNFAKVNSWTFVSDNYKFADPALPFSLPRQDVHAIQTLCHQTSQLHICSAAYQNG